MLAASNYARICLKYHRGRVEMTLWSRALPLPGHFDSQIKDSSNSFRRRHSSEGVDAKFSSTLPNLVQLYQKTCCEMYKNKHWRFLALGVLFFGRKTSVVEVFSCLNALKNKSLTLPGHFDRFKMVHVDSQIKEFLKFKSKILPIVSSKSFQWRRWCQI